MNQTSNYIAVDLGASSGRVVLGRWDGARFALEEMHRFANDPVSVMGHLHWDVLRLWADIKAGISTYAGKYREAPSGIGLATWGVDFGLLDRSGVLLGNPYHYRDSRTDGMDERAFNVVPRRQIFAQTGIQFMQINTLYQLFSMVQNSDPQLDAARTLLLMPNLFYYWLSGQKVAEYTDATTTQCFDAREQRWANDLLGRFSIPTHMLPPVVMPGTVLGDLLPGVAADVGLQQTAPVIAIGSHDTASAVAAIPDMDAHSIYISSGTWSLMGVETSEPVLTERALALNFTNEGGVGGTIRLLKNIAGLWLVQECRRQWQREGHSYEWEELLLLAEQAPPFRSLVDPDATTFLNPGNMPAALRDYCRRTGQPVPESVGAVVRCCIESLALKYRQVLGDLEGLVGHRLDTVRIVGGGCRNRMLCAFTADACDRHVVAGPVEATALGSILVQAIARGELQSLAEGRRAVAASVSLERYEPRNRAAWEETFARFSSLRDPAALSKQP
ncbi:MAG: rhamnulokinase family protein [Chloroflexota bacterium]